MTNEEAIKRLKSDIYKYSDFTENPNENEFWTAFDMAIKALAQEPCEDCISRQAVLDCFKKWQPYMATRLWDFEQELLALPPVTPQPKIGRWIEDVDRWGDIVTTVNGYRCSECNAFNTDKDNFCPNCGAKMEEVEE